METRCVCLKHTHSKIERSAAFPIENPVYLKHICSQMELSAALAIENLGCLKRLCSKMVRSAELPIENSGWSKAYLLEKGAGCRTANRKPGLSKEHLCLSLDVCLSTAWAQLELSHCKPVEPTRRSSSCTLTRPGGFWIKVWRNRFRDV